LNDDVMIAVDPHKASNTAAVLDPVSKTVIESARFANTADGYGRLTAFAARWAQRRWAVRDALGRAGRWLGGWSLRGSWCSMSRPSWLPGSGCIRGHGRKTDKDDAVSVGLAALDGTGIRLVTCDDALVSLRLLCDRRDELSALRTQAVCRLHRLLAELTPGGMRRELSANKAQALLARIRPAGDVGQVRVHIARDHLADIRALDARIKYIGTQIAALVTASGTGLTGLYGIGPVIAGLGRHPGTAPVINPRHPRAGGRRVRGDAPPALAVEHPHRVRRGTCHLGRVPGRSRAGVGHIA
jgi:transposase